MHLSRTMRILAIFVTILSVLATVASADKDERAPQDKRFGWHGQARQRVQLGPRPFYLVDKMEGRIPSGDG